MRFSHLVFALSALSVAAAAGAVWEGVRLARAEFPDPAPLRTQFPVVEYNGPDEPPSIRIQRQRPMFWASLGEVSPAAVGAVVVSEDWAFYEHPGYDSRQIKEALKEDWEEGRFARGASTITQQVVRNVYLEKDKNLWRKLKELVLAVRLEQAVRKRRILEIYLNIAEWGEGVFGIRAASHLYFGKEPAQLTAKEGAFLAMLLPSPKRYSASFRKHQLTDYARETVDSILHKMTQARYLTEEERALEAASPLAFERSL
jgi:monofunctional biosynthetic peptidoglycan transglycosylase